MRLYSTSGKTQKGDGIFGFYPYIHIRHNLGSTVVSSARWPYFTPKEYPLVFICVRGWVDPKATEGGQKE